MKTHPYIWGVFQIIKIKLVTKPKINININIYYDEEKECYEIFVDETFKDNKAAYTVYYNKDSENNYYSRVEGEQTLQNAVYQGILHALKHLPKDIPINFIIDRNAVIDVLQRIPTKYKDRQYMLHLDTIIQIENELKLRIAKVEFTHCYSHIKDNDDDVDKTKRNEERFGFCS